MSLHSCFLYVKAIISDLTSFISGTSAVIFLNVIFAQTSPPLRRLFGRALSRSSTPILLFDVCSQEARFGSSYGCVPEETQGNTGYECSQKARFTSTSGCVPEETQGDTCYDCSQEAPFKSSYCCVPEETHGNTGYNCSQEARFRSTYGCVPEETHGDPGYDCSQEGRRFRSTSDCVPEETHGDASTVYGSKGNIYLFLFFSCFNC